MPWTSLRFSPGINRNMTRYAASGTWYDGSLVRFRDGLPERWAGWVRDFEALEAVGIIRSLHRFSTLDGFTWVGVGTSKKFYVASDDLAHDVSPIEETGTLGANPFATTNLSTTVTVTDVSHGRFAGNFVVFSGTVGFAGIPAGDFNQEHEVVSVINDDSYTIVVDTPANATTTGGGGAVVYSYVYPPGSDDQISGGGWGSLTWGEEEWGGDPALGAGDRLGIWTQDNWGEDLIANPAGGPIFYWDATTPSARMVDILDLPGADGNAPAFAEFIIVSHIDRHLIAFGAQEFGTGLPAPMSFRWSNQENILQWDEASVSQTSGSLPLSTGSKFISAIPASREIIAWTDAAMYSIQYIGQPFIYRADVIESASDILGLKACANFNGDIYWMGKSGIFVYNGRVSKIICPVWDYVSSRLNLDQSQKVVAAANQIHNEVMWFYPSNENGNLENDSYVSFDIIQNVWSFGILARTAWLDIDSQNKPLGASPTDGRLYQHENGSDDGSQNPPLPISAYIESAPFEISSEGAYDKGDRFMFIRRILPDVTFRNFTESGFTPEVLLTMKMMDKPGGGFDTSSDDNMVSRTVTVPVEEFTDEVHVRLRGRAMVLRAASNTRGTQWRLGVPRIDVRPDGQR